MNLSLDLFAALSLLYYCLCGFTVSFRCSVLYYWLLQTAFFVLLRFFTPLRVLLIPYFLFLATVLVYTVFAASFREKDAREPFCLIALGVRGDSTLPPALFAGRVRLIKRIRNEHPNTLTVLSGGKVFAEKESEAAALKNALDGASFSGALILEERSRTTAENLRFSLALIPENLPVLVVTSHFAAFRAKRILKKLAPGRETCVIGEKSHSILTPHLYLREFLTFSVELLRGNLCF